ncbi:hypothetical protein CCAL13119_00980 [Campylobacter sp. RM13119]|uniref:Uncharacterized protein n=1 Tax=Campylobacter californiensis TaxID=1032243 RepID=A0ABD4JH19_9BACT|nr:MULTISPECIES: hypothetical protein [unclassified Campylobacter]MBE2986023.1 hypothetical protein [Campylobacter sp. RM12919]MBE2988297.1 hypothetical protein [Campylobacter sp. RM12920]MBE3022732.1 hypothetical protein [Campylobacter sp. 7477a]MBE3605533.1 hypothetical protein [Campylobacter sp. RM13119]MBE3609210.1 hypothetical protein [Campylobacter sp. RM12916]
MNDFFDSLKDIKKELVKEQGVSLKPQKDPQNAKQDAIKHKQDRLKDEFLSYIKNSDIRKI